MPTSATAVAIDASVDPPGDEAADERRREEQHDRDRLGELGRDGFDDEHRRDARPHGHPLHDDDGREHIPDRPTVPRRPGREQAERHEQPEVERLHDERGPAVELRDLGRPERPGEQRQPEHREQDRHVEPEPGDRASRERGVDPVRQRTQVESPDQQREARHGQADDRDVDREQRSVGQERRVLAVLVEEVDEDPRREERPAQGTAGDRREHDQQCRHHEEAASRGPSRCPPRRSTCR